MNQDKLQQFAELVGRSVTTAGLLATLRPDASDTSVLKAMQEALVHHIYQPAIPNLQKTADSAPHS